MVLPFIVIAAIVGFVSLIGLGALTVFIPALSNIIWVILLFVIAYFVSKTDVGNFEVYSNKNIKLNITALLILPALALLFLTLLRVNLNSFFGSASYFIGSIGLGSVNSGGVFTVIQEAPPDALQVFGLSLIVVIISAWVLTQKKKWFK